MEMSVAHVKMAYIWSQEFSLLGCIWMGHTDDKNVRDGDFFLSSSFFPFSLYVPLTF